MYLFQRDSRRLTNADLFVLCQSESDVTNALVATVQIDAVTVCAHTRTVTLVVVCDNIHVRNRPSSAQRTRLTHSPCVHTSVGYNDTRYRRSNNSDNNMKKVVVTPCCNMRAAFHYV